MLLCIQICLIGGWQAKIVRWFAVRSHNTKAECLSARIRRTNVAIDDAYGSKEKDDPSSRSTH